MAESNGRDPKTGQFLKGWKGGPGRPKGYREKLINQYLQDLFEAWKTRGVEALQGISGTDLVKVVASHTPKESEVSVTKRDDIRQLTDEQILELIADTDAALIQIGFAAGVIGTAEDTGKLN